MSCFSTRCLVWVVLFNMLQAEATTSLLGHMSLQKGSVELEQHLRAIAISPVAIGLICTSLVIIMCITMLLIKWRANTHKIEKLHARVRGLHHSLMMEEAKNTKSKEKEDALKAMISKEAEYLTETERAIADEESQIQAGDAELKKDRALIATQKAEIKFLTAEEKALINDIIQRGKVHVDLEKKVFRFVEPIEFAAEYIYPDMDEAPPARFANPAVAREIIGDLAQVMNYVKAIVLVEGHTSGGEQAMSQIGFQVACERAEKVVETLLEFGIEPKRLEAKGMPGLLGDNKPDVKLVTLSWGV